MHRSATDLTFLLSLGLIPLACTLDVGDALTDTLTTVADGTEGDMGGGTEGNASDGTDGSDDDGGGDGPDPTGLPGSSGNPGTGGNPGTSAGSGDGDPTGGPADDSGGYGGYGTDGGLGPVPEICMTWALHATECGVGEYAAEYCQQMMLYASYLGPGCAAAIDEYYSCLTMADCATINASPDTVCNPDAVNGACGL